VAANALDYEAVSRLAPTGAEASVRVSDAERERVVAQLKKHALAGRLNVAELGDRTQEAYTARTAADLDHALRELPDLEAWAYRLLHMSLRAHLALFLTVTAAVLLMWALTRQPDPAPTDLGAGYYWPVWLLAPWAVLLGTHVFRSRGAGRRALDAGR
jgi:hypothetical protein